MSPTSAALTQGINQEIERWCLAAENYPGEIHPKLIFKVIHQLVPHFRAAIEGDAVLNLLVVAQRLAAAGKFCVSEREIVAALAAMLPQPTSIAAQHHLTLAQTLGLVEQVLPGTLDSTKEHWELERLRAPLARAA